MAFRVQSMNLRHFLGEICAIWGERGISNLHDPLNVAVRQKDWKDNWKWRVAQQYAPSKLAAISVYVWCLDSAFTMRQLDHSGNLHLFIYYPPHDTFVWNTCPRIIPLRIIKQFYEYFYCAKDLYRKVDNPRVFLIWKCTAHIPRWISSQFALQALGNLGNSCSMYSNKL